MYQKKVKENNENRLLYYLYKNQNEFTILEISKVLNMSFPTVKKILDTLLKNKIIKETLITDSKLGRKAKHFIINKDFIYGIGVRLLREELEIILINESGEIKKEFFIKEKFTSTNITQMLRKYLNKFLAKIDIDSRGKISGIGIGIPGLVMLEKDSIEIDTGLFLTFKEIKEMEEEFKLKIIIENNCNISALGEKFLNKGKEIKNFISLNISEKISMSIFKEDIDKGSFSVFSPRIEHMSIDINGKKCECGRKGCLGLYINKRNFNLLNQELLNEYLNYFSEGIKNIIFLYNPEKIIISGFLCNYIEIIKEKLLKKIYKNNIFFNGKETIQFSYLKDESIILGSGILPIIDRLF